ncbi:MAG TPA: class I SAM-dependent methyltransferase [Acidimicrobiales bacterium]|nr:class I SAM-dependent methyltransferase [Acidimicrobiales bacterium]
MSFYEDHLLPRLNDVALRGREFARIRERVAAGLSGEVLEVGFGSGLNVPHYPPSVDRVLAVDPATVGRKLATKRVSASAVTIEYVGLDAQTLPVESSSIDHALVTWSLCTIPEADRALREILRVLRRGGELHFVDHGHSPDPKVAHWQDRLTPLQRRLGGGCHLNRQIDELVAKAGFELSRIENYYTKGPKPYSYMFEGVATKP